MEDGCDGKVLRCGAGERHQHLYRKCLAAPGRSFAGLAVYEKHNTGTVPVPAQNSPLL
jgi:hypothetical protein